MLIYYKSMRWIDGKLTKVITDEKDNIVQNPTKEQINMSIFDNRYTSKKNRRKHEKRVCCSCGSNETYVNNHGVPVWHSCNCIDKECTRWLCNNCRSKIDNMSLWRIGRLSKYSKTGKGVIGQWVVAKYLGVEDLNIKMDNFNFHIDLIHPIYGCVQVKLSLLNKYGKWDMVNIGWYFDTLFIVCMSDNFGNVERVYIIPEGDIISETRRVSITKNPKLSLGPFMYDKFKVDEKPFDNIYNTVDIPDIFDPLYLWEGKYNKRNKEI